MVSPECCLLSVSVRAPASQISRVPLPISFLSLFRHIDGEGSGRWREEQGHRSACKFGRFWQRPRFLPLPHHLPESVPGRSRDIFHSDGESFVSVRWCRGIIRVNIQESVPAMGFSLTLRVMLNFTNWLAMVLMWGVEMRVATSSCNGERLGSHLQQHTVSPFLTGLAAQKSLTADEIMGTWMS